jgi:hypothetical protein
MLMRTRTLVSTALWWISAQRFRRSSGPCDIRLVVAADWTHFASLVQLLDSVEHFEPNASVGIWNLGLEDDQIQFIAEHYPAHDLRNFDFASQPQWLHVLTYAWKPQIVSYESFGRGGLLVYLDAGDRLTSSLTWIKRFTQSTGFFSPWSKGTVGRWTHPTTLRALSWRDSLATRNLNGAIVAFDLDRPAARELLGVWASSSLQRDLIAPEGASPENHRYDQALLTILANQREMVAPGHFRALNPRLGVLIHQDVD